MSETPETDRWFTPWRFGILLALLIFAWFPQVLLGLQTFVVRDYGFFAYPLASFQQQCLQRGELPLWDPYNNCGVPFLAQWNTMPFYPPMLVCLRFPLPWALGFFCLLHLWFAGFGMYRLARRWTGNNFAAAFAGTAFAFNGLTLNLLMWPSHLATWSWAPWVVLAVELAWREGMQKIILAAIAGAMQMLAGGPEIIGFTWLILLALWLQQFISGESRRGPLLWRFPLVVALVISLTAVQLLPFLDLVAHAQRATGYADLRWSMPGRGWANFLVPMAFGRTWTEGVFFQNGQYWTSSYYLGIATLWLMLLALWTVRDRRAWLLGGVAGMGLILALGGNTPVYPALRQLIPQLSFITYPIKFVLLVVFAAPLLAALALARPESSPRRILSIGATLLFLLAAILFWTWQFPLPTDDTRATLLNGWVRALFLLITGGLLLLRAGETKTGLRRFVPLLLIFVTWLDVLTHEPTQNPTVPNWVLAPDLSRAKLALQPQPELGGSRVMVSPAAQNAFMNFSARDPQNNYLAKRLGYCANCNLLDNAPKVDGFFSLTPRESDDVLSLLYGATNADFPRLADFLGVSQITAPDEIFHWQSRRSCLPLITAGQQPVFLNAAGTLRALTRPDFDSRRVVFLPPAAASSLLATNPAAAHVLDSKFTNRTVDFDIETPAPTIAVVAQTWYHDWRAEVDGRPAPLLRANHAFQAVPVPAGRHHVHLVYQDKLLEIGVAISICMWVNCLISLPLMRHRPLPVEPVRELD